MDAVQSGLGKNDLGHQVILLTREIEDLKEKHRYKCHLHNIFFFWGGVGGYRLWVYVNHKNIHYYLPEWTALPTETGSL